MKVESNHKYFYITNSGINRAINKNKSYKKHYFIVDLGTMYLYNNKHKVKRYKKP